jgi:hypothetical protein
MREDSVGNRMVEVDETVEVVDQLLMIECGAVEWWLEGEEGDRNAITMETKIKHHTSRMAFGLAIVKIID